MDSKTRIVTILLVMSVFALAIGMVAYSNRDSMTSSLSKNESENESRMNYVNGDQLTEEELHAFLNDETFFDYDRTNYQAKAKEKLDSNTLYMVASSVSRDIRLAITDVFGHPVTGVPFVVTVEEAGEYKDLNQDGIITIPDLTAGDYHVILENVDGYTVPETSMLVAVKDQLEFKVIDDISYFVYTEDMIDALVEDTEADIGTEDYDDTGSNLKPTEVKDIFGIDVSKYQKDIDWNRVAASGVKFAIIRCGYRGSKSGVLVEDPYFKKNIEGAKAAGIKVGVYFFTQAVNETEAVEEASMAVALAKNFGLDYPIFIDSEGAGGNGRADALDKEQRTAILVAFCETVNNAGFNAGVYSSRCWYNDKLDADKLEDYCIWDAEYRSSPLYKGRYDIWQYSSAGTIDGIDTRVDLNISYKDY